PLRSSRTRPPADRGRPRGERRAGPFAGATWQRDDRAGLSRRERLRNATQPLRWATGIDGDGLRSPRRRRRGRHLRRADREGGPRLLEPRLPQVVVGVGAEAAARGARLAG